MGDLVAGRTGADLQRVEHAAPLGILSVARLRAEHPRHLNAYQLFGMIVVGGELGAQHDLHAKPGLHALRLGGIGDAGIGDQRKNSLQLGPVGLGHIGATLKAHLLPDMVI